MKNINTLGKKLILSEDIEIIATVPAQEASVEIPMAQPVQSEPMQELINEPAVKPEPSPELLKYSSMINALIKGEWDAIELYNSMVEEFKLAGNTAAVATISDITAEEYIHVGQLEGLLKTLDCNANSIEEGNQEFGQEGMPEVVEPAPAPAVGQFAQPSVEPAPVAAPAEVAPTEFPPDDIAVSEPAPMQAQSEQQEEPKEEKHEDLDSEGNAIRGNN